MMRAAESLIAAAPRGATLVEVGVDAWNHDGDALPRLGYRASSVKRGGNGAVIVLLRRSIAELQASS